MPVTNEGFWDSTPKNLAILLVTVPKRLLTSVGCDYFIIFDPQSIDDSFECINHFAGDNVFVFISNHHREQLPFFIPAGSMSQLDVVTIFGVPTIF